MEHENSWMQNWKTDHGVTTPEEIMLRSDDVSRIPMLLQGYGWLHVSGITPALDPGCADFVLNCLKTAWEMGLTTSFDSNLRTRLRILNFAREIGLKTHLGHNAQSEIWTWGKARDFCLQCLPYVDVLIGMEPFHLRKDDIWLQDEVFQHIIERYPNIKCIARHMRYPYSGSQNALKAFMWYQRHTYESNLFTYHVADRIDGNDAFIRGLIHAIRQGYAPADLINFAAASAVSKHSA